MNCLWAQSTAFQLPAVAHPIKVLVNHGGAAATSWAPAARSCPIFVLR